MFGPTCWSPGGQPARAAAGSAWRAGDRSRTFSYDRSGRAIDRTSEALNSGGWRTVPAPAEEILLAIRAGR